LGASPFGGDLDEREAFAQLDAYTAAGGTFIDTARTYGKDSISERVLGKWLAERGNRDRLVIATKGGQRVGPVYERTLRYEQLSQQIDESLQHLRTDYVDLYYVHVDDPAVPVEEIIDTLNDKVKEGKIRYFGCSNWEAGRIEEANRYAERAGKAGFAVNEIEWSLATVNHSNEWQLNNVWMDGEMYRFHQRAKLPACAYSSQARGYFAILDQFGEASLREALIKQYDSPRNRNMLQRLQKLSEQSGIPVTLIAIAYICHKKRDFFGLPIVSCLTLDQLSQCVSADAIKLDAAMLDFLEAGRYS
jgi:aryl-alcohol dehydrogenase-like predicted oxidoreductase